MPEPEPLILSGFDSIRVSDDGSAIIMDVVEKSGATATWALPYAAVAHLLLKLSNAARSAESRMAVAPNPRRPSMRAIDALALIDVDPGMSVDGQFITLELIVSLGNSATVAFPSEKSAQLRERLAQLEAKAHVVRDLPRQ